MWVSALRIDVARWRAAQFLAPIGVAGGVVARRWGDPLLQIVVGVLYLYVLVALLRARRRLGRRELRVVGEAVHLGDVEIARSSVQRWALDRTEARLDEPDTSWRLRADVGDEATLQTSLSELFGAPLLLRRRGSRLARGVAAGCSFLGLGSVALGVEMNDPRLGFAGTLVASFALTAWYGLARKIVKYPHDR